ncbi:glycosyltransferase family 4 protein [Ferrovum myxofaciens]|uniref:glycosyltransferase family 4 protein n=1 Tax=Ferrovum myxofaciens TaxID=416213 RepID=UPI003EB8A8B6
MTWFGQSNQKMINVVVVDDLPTPYRLALFRDIAELGVINLNVVYLAAKANEKQWQLQAEGHGFGVHYLRDIQLYIKSIDTRFQFSWGAGQILHRLKPDVIVVGGYHQIGYWRCLLHCSMHRIPLIVWSGSTLDSEWRPGNWLVRKMKSFFVRRADRAFAYGTAAKRFLESLGMASENVYKLYNTTDLQVLRRRWLEEQAWKTHDFEVVKFLFTGRLTPYKGLQKTLSVLSRMSESKFYFRIVGDGHYRNEAEALVAKLGLGDRVEFVGYVQQEQLAEHLAWADVFVFASVQEVWGIVVNEALATGLFVLSSTLAGVTEDMIIPEFTGLPIDPLSDEAISQGLRYCLDNIHDIRVKRDERSLWSLKFSTQEIRHEFVRGVSCALVRKGK